MRYNAYWFEEVFFAELLFIEDGILGQELLEPGRPFFHVVEEELYVFRSGSYWFAQVAINS